MNPDRLRRITGQYNSLRIAIVGDFCLDRYLEIDPQRKEISLETNLPVYNVEHVRSQPGGAGTILNNLVALGIGELFPVGFAGEDGEGFELTRALARMAGVTTKHFLQTPSRRTFTYTKPLLMERGKAPLELNRLDFKNWSPTPPAVSQVLQESVTRLADRVDAMILLDQVDLVNTGVVTRELLETVGTLASSRPKVFVVADSRRGLKDFPPVSFKMNRAEFNRLTGMAGECPLEAMQAAALELARRNGRPVFVSLAENGILGASPTGQADHVPALPVHGEIDIVGAGDAVTANLAAAWSAGASLAEALELAMLAASIVVHQLGTTGTASVSQLSELHQSYGRRT
jgi:rfaE bifunctional protein kinase chain/domain